MPNQITPNPSVPSQVVAEVKFPKFINNLGIIPTSYKDSMSYYECLAWLCKYLEETVIPTVNQNGEAVEELQALYVELNSYVTNYFDTLDVQEEINNKLDEMVEDGTLEEIIGEYLNTIAIYGYDTINDMKSSEDLKDGSYVRTLGYSSLNDLAGGLYKIRTKTNEDVIDEFNIISITSSENLIAELIHENEIIGFNSVEDMKESNKLVNGMIAKTLGYYSAGDGGNGIYKISASEPLGYYEELESGFYAELVSDIHNILCYGVTLDDSNENNHSIINNILNYTNIIECKKDFVLANTLEITDDYTKFTFNKIEYTGDSGFALIINGLHCEINGLEITSGYDGIRVGKSNVTMWNQININQIIAEHDGIVCGGSTGVYSNTFDIKRVTYKHHGLLFDHSQYYTGELHFENMNFTDDSDSSVTNQFAIYGDFSNYRSTGMTFENISFEGAKGGFHLYTTNAGRPCENLIVNGCRCSELSIRDNKKVFKVTAPQGGYLYGEFHFDMAKPSAFDFSEYLSAYNESFRLIGSFREEFTQPNNLIGLEGYPAYGTLIITKLPLSQFGNDSTNTFIPKSFFIPLVGNVSTHSLKLGTGDYRVNGTFKIINASANSKDLNILDNAGNTLKTVTMASYTCITLTVGNTAYSTGAHMIRETLTSCSYWDIPAIS